MSITARRVSTILACLLTILVLTRHAAHLSKGLSYVVSQQTIDDTYYYLNTAWHHAHEPGFPSFDGFNRTNGVQPGWYLLLYGLAHAYQDKVEYLFSALILASLLSGLAVMLALVLARMLGLSWACFLLPALVAALVCTGQLTLSGMEFALSLVAQLLLLITLAGTLLDPRRGHWVVAVGLAAALSVAVRIDNVLIVSALAFPLFRAARADGVSRKRFWAAAVVPTVACCAALALFYYTSGGSVLPVSSLWKAKTARAIKLAQATLVAERPLGWISPFLGRWATSIVLWPLVLTAWVLIVRGAKHPAFLLVSTYAFAALAHQVALVSFGGSESIYPFWYQTPQFLAACLCLLTVLDRLDNHRSVSLALGCVMTAWAIASLLSVARQNLTSLALDKRGSWSARNQRILMARYLRQRFPRGTRFAAFNAGELGFFSDQPVTNLDGLANSYAYYQFRARRSALDFCRQQGIRYFVDYRVPAAFSRAGKVIARLPMLPRRPIVVIDLGARP